MCFEKERKIHSGFRLTDGEQLKSELNKSLLTVEHLMDERTSAVNEQIRLLQEENEKLNATIADLRAKHRNFANTTSLTTQVSAARANLEHLHEVHVLSTKYEEAQAELEERRVVVASLNTQIDSLTARLESAHTHAQQMIMEKQKFEQKCLSAGIELEELQKDKDHAGLCI